MRKSKVDPDVEAKAKWHKALATVGVVNAGDYVMELTIDDGNDKQDPIKWFIDAFGYWEKLFRDQKWIKTEKQPPDKIIRAIRHGL
jgi:hypothetical protein